MELVGYISQCYDHESVIVTDMKPEQNVVNGNQRQVYTQTAEVYSTAVKCHSQGVPAVLYVVKDETGHGRLIATGIDPIDLTEDDVKKRLECIRIAINNAERRVYVLNEYADKIVGGFLSAFTNYRHFNKKYEEGYSDITCALHNVDELKEILDRESKQ
ncbi:MAG: hypothetical protein IKE69_11505 [Thermoguttaceae bacterium]|nr:hypothetical protein [Thermoguttaceae bacterium]